MHIIPQCASPNRIIVSRLFKINYRYYLQYMNNDVATRRTPVVLGCKNELSYNPHHENERTDIGISHLP